MQRAKVVAESVLNEYNTEIYISLSSQTTWSGSLYIDYAKDAWTSSAVAITNKSLRATICLQYLSFRYLGQCRCIGHSALYLQSVY